MDPLSSTSSSGSDELANVVGEFKTVWKEIKAKAAAADPKVAEQESKPKLGRLLFSENLMRPMVALPYKIAGRYSGSPQRWELASGEKVALGDITALYLQECVDLDPRVALPYMVAGMFAAVTLPRAIEQLDEYIEKRRKVDDGKTPKAES